MNYVNNLYKSNINLTNSFHFVVSIWKQLIELRSDIALIKLLLILLVPSIWPVASRIVLWNASACQSSIHWVNVDLHLPPGAPNRRETEVRYPFPRMLFEKSPWARLLIFFICRNLRFLFFLDRGIGVLSHYKLCGRVHCSHYWRLHYDTFYYLLWMLLFRWGFLAAWRANLRAYFLKDYFFQHY